MFVSNVFLRYLLHAFNFQGISKKDAAPEIQQMIVDIQLADKADSQSRSLSGGMKRKLK